ncbi:MAG: RNA polymerase sigma factor [Crocinitomicaceae bacterium]
MSTLEFNSALIDLESYLKSFAYQFTKNEDDAKDLTQETMMKAFIYRTYYTPKTNFKAWVFTIMRNIFINQYRRKMKAKTIFDNSEESYLLNQASSNGNSPENLLIAQEIQEKITNLDEEYKKPFEMHFLGFKYKEIAEELTIPIGTVKSRIFIARQKLMNSLPEYENN